MPSQLSPDAAKEPSAEASVNGPQLPGLVEGYQQQGQDPAAPSSTGSGPGSQRGFGNGWGSSTPVQGQSQGMGRKKGSFSQYLSPPVSNDASRDSPSSTPQPSRFALPTDAAVHIDAAGSSSAVVQESMLASTLHMAVHQNSASASGNGGQAAGTDFFTSYNAVLGGAPVIAQQRPAAYCGNTMQAQPFTLPGAADHDEGWSEAAAVPNQHSMPAAAGAHGKGWSNLAAASNGWAVDDGMGQDSAAATAQVEEMTEVLL